MTAHPRTTAGPELPDWLWSDEPTYLSPAILDHWPALIERASMSPPQFPTLAELKTLDKAERDRTVRAIRRWIETVGPMRTRDTDRFAQAVTDTIETNAFRSAGGRRVLLVDGVSKLGKTQAIMRHVLAEAREVWKESDQREATDAVIPFVYIEANAEAGLRGQLQHLLAFLGHPFGPGETAPALLTKLMHVLPAVRCRAVIIDDAHMLRRVDRSSRVLTDGLKKLITATPTTLVFVGAGLADSALLGQVLTRGYPASAQISLRGGEILEMRPWRHTRLGDAWSVLVARLEASIVIPSGVGDVGALTSRGRIRTLHEECLGRPGILIDAVKESCKIAVQRGRPVSDADIARGVVLARGRDRRQ